MKWQPRWHRHASSHSAPTLNHNWSGSCNMSPVKHTFWGQSRQVHDQCTLWTCAGWPESSLEFAESKTVKDQRQRLVSSDTLPEQTAAALWTGPRSAGTHCLEPQNNTAYYTGLLCIPKVRIWGFVWEHTKSSLDFQDNTVCTHLFTNS